MAYLSFDIEKYVVLHQSVPTLTALEGKPIGSAYAAVDYPGLVLDRRLPARPPSTSRKAAICSGSRSSEQRGGRQNSSRGTLEPSPRRQHQNPEYVHQPAPPRTGTGTGGGSENWLGVARGADKDIEPDFS